MASWASYSYGARQFRDTDQQSQRFQPGRAGLERRAGVERVRALFAAEPARLILASALRFHVPLIMIDD